MAEGPAYVKVTKRLVLDANILLRAVLGVRVLSLLESYEDVATFYSPDVCFENARQYVPEVAAHRGFDPSAGLLVLDRLSRFVQVVDRSLYELQEVSARKRISSRDAADWPIVATALLLDCPIWTEDQDFFGSGMATWTTANVELYLQDA
jgi:predicted nucleic acid-binding protein